MPGFTSVNYRQRAGGTAAVSLSSAGSSSPPAPPEVEEQVGGGLGSFGVDLAKGALKTASKAQKAATGLGAAVLTSRAGYKPFTEVLNNADSILSGAKVAAKVKKAKKAAAAAAKAGKRAGNRTGKAGQPARGPIKGQKAIEGPKDLLPIGSRALVPVVDKVGRVTKAGATAAAKAKKPSAKELLNAATKLGVRAGEKLKNKKLGDIIQGASTTGRALKGAAKELGKRGGKAIAAAAVTGGFTAGIAATANYLEHVAKGGEPMNGEEIGLLAADTGLRLAMRGLDGELTRKVATEEVIRGYNNIIKRKQGGRAIPKNINVNQTLGNLGKLLGKLNKIHERRHYQVNGEAPLALETRRPFGSGSMTRGGQSFGGGRRRRAPRRHRCRRKRKGGKRKRCSHGSRKLHNIFTPY